MGSHIPFLEKEYYPHICFFIEGNKSLQCVMGREYTGLCM